MIPAYDFEQFRSACNQGVSAVFVMKGAMETAKSDFTLSTQAALLSFVAANGLEKLLFINSKIWEKNPDPANPVMVDAYHFSSGAKYGYTAFMFQQKTNRWIVKSFKAQSDPRNLAFSNALEGLKLQLEGNVNE